MSHNHDLLIRLNRRLSISSVDLGIAVGTDEKHLDVPRLLFVFLGTRGVKTATAMWADMCANPTEYTDHLNWSDDGLNRVMPDVWEILTKYLGEDRLGTKPSYEPAPDKRVLVEV